MELLYKASNIEIRHASSTGILYCTWIGFQEAGPLKDACNMIYELLKKTKCSKIFNDNTHVIGSWNHSTEWIKTYLFPLLVEAGLKKLAWIFSDDISSQISAYRVTPSISVVKTFLSKEEALAWLIDYPND
jgi:hypothetical protein